MTPNFIEVTYNMDKLRESLVLYGKLTKLSEGEIVVKQAGKLAWNIYNGLRKLRPVKGSIRAERIAAMAAGGGIKIRASVYKEIASKYNLSQSVATRGNSIVKPSRSKRVGRVVQAGASIEIRGKKMNFQALAAQRELSIRETGIGFSAFSVPRPSTRSYAQAVHDMEYNRLIDSRYGFLLSSYGVKVGDKGSVAELKWLGEKSQSYKSAVEGLSKPNQMAVLNEAIKETEADVMVYVNRKMNEVKEAARL